MSFNEQLPEWNATGAEPPQSKKDNGWSAEEKPPADWFNWLFNRLFKVTQELQNGAETPSGAQVKADAAEAAANAYTDQQVGAIQLTAGNVSVADSAGNFTASDVEGVLAELKQYANDGKQGIVTALIGVGQSTAQVTMTFAQLTALIEAIANFDATKLLIGTTVAGKPGTMPNRAGRNASGGTTQSGVEIQIVPPQGYYDGVDDYVYQSDADFDAGNWPETVNLFGKQGIMPVRGQYEGYSPGHRVAVTIDASNGNIYLKAPYGNYPVDTWIYFSDSDFHESNIPSHLNMLGLQGTMPSYLDTHVNNAGKSVGAFSGDGIHYLYMLAPQGYYNGATYVRSAEPNLVPSKIKYNENIAGVVGTYDPAPEYAFGVVKTSYPNLVITGLDANYIYGIDGSYTLRKFNRTTGTQVYAVTKSNTDLGGGASMSGGIRHYGPNGWFVLAYRDGSYYGELFNESNTKLKYAIRDLIYSSAGFFAAQLDFFVCSYTSNQLGVYNWSHTRLGTIGYALSYQKYVTTPSGNIVVWNPDPDDVNNKSSISNLSGTTLISAGDRYNKRMFDF